jgi:hypothetical protein
VAAEVLWDSLCQKQSRAKQFMETWFTDHETATLLANAASPIGMCYSQSAVAEASVASADASLLQAVQASLAEPYMFRPVCINGRHYVGGAIDLLPVELAALLACQTIAVKQPPLDRLFETMVTSVFLYEARERRGKVERFPVRHRIDMSDHSTALERFSFWPAPKQVADEAHIQAVAPGEYKAARAYLIPRYRIVDGVPEDHAEFLRCVQAQWRYGYGRARQAFELR